ncbi:MAG: hypothetical protein H6581_30695 [Bacteroidia bacterium]|nr:hypothetical protein [Bacteroidia bacterium]
MDDKKGVHLNAWKPVIYLYPEVETEVRVKLNFAGKLDFTYPPAANAWTVTAQPDGTLQTADGRKYSYLFWEGPFDENTWDISEGYCVGRVDVVSFLEEKLPWFGLNEREMEDFITFWAPKMQQNPFNWIHFSTQEYTDRANLCIEPEPDALIRVFMVYSPLEVAVKGTGQDLPKLERKGFTVVEWGGTELPLPEN